MLACTRDNLDMVRLLVEEGIYYGNAIFDQHNNNMLFLFPFKINQAVS